MNHTDIIWAKVPLKSNPEKFYGFFRNNMDDLIHMFPSKFKSFEFLEGEDFTTGSVMHWKYHLGNPEAAKVKMEDVDDENKCITYEVVEGDVLNHYKVFKAKVHAIELGGKGQNYAKWSIEFEKANEHVPSPEIYLDFAVKVSKGLDAHISNHK